VFGTTALSYPALVDVNLGNVSILVRAFAAVGWGWLDRPAGSVALAAAVALRAPAAVIPLWQALRGRWRPVAWTVGAGLVMILVTLPVVGVQGYLDDLRMLGTLRDLDRRTSSAGRGRRVSRRPESLSRG
jgi:hypothetical protein